MSGTALPDTIYAVETLQYLAIFAGVGLAGYILLRKKKFTRTIKLSLWGLALIATLTSTAVYSYSLYVYVHDSRSLYQQEDRQNGSSS